MSHGPNKLLWIARRCVKSKFDGIWYFHAFADISGWKVVVRSFGRGADGLFVFYKIDHFVGPEGERVYVSPQNFDAPTLKALREFKPKDDD